VVGLVAQGCEATAPHDAISPHQDFSLHVSRQEGIEAIVFRTVSDQPTLRDAILPPELLVLPVELARLDARLDDPMFFAPFAAPSMTTTPR
jgi:hypothetical protein